MTEPTRTIKIYERTHPALKILAATTSETMMDLIERLIQQEKQTMNATTPTLTIGSIVTKPEHDPYTNISGIVSKTVLKLDPRDMTVWVTQEYNDNSTPSDEWHGLVLTWSVQGHPVESSMREWIDEHMAELQRICDGYESVWDGSNHIGRLTDDARTVKEAIEFELNNGEGLFTHYEYWSVESWLESTMSDIAADTTDEALRAMASEAITALDSNQILDTDEDGAYKHLADHRDNLKWDAEQDDE